MMAALKQTKPKDYDERVYRRGHPPHRTRIALIAIALLLIGSYFAWTKSVPFQHPYELHAVFTNGVNIRDKSPVRIAGVNVGEVTGIKRLGDNADVTFTVEDKGQPIHSDAEVEIRPRIFLEGNFFLDVRPGSPSAPELSSGATIPVTHTSTAVQLDEVLTALQAPDRESLIRLLSGFGTGLNHVPTAAEDVGQDPSVRGKTGGEAIAQTFRYGGPASRDSAIVAEALQGTQPHDLSRLVGSLSDVFATLAARETQVQDLITNFNTTAGAFASESNNLSATIRDLAPTLEIARPSLVHLNDSFPALRAWARDITPGIKQLPATIKAGTPWLNQVYKLEGRKELKYVAHQVQLSGPPLGSTGVNGPQLFVQLERSSRCFDDVLIPTGDIAIPNNGSDSFSTGSSNFKDFFYAAANLAGGGAMFDGNGPLLRVQPGGGPQSVRTDNPGLGGGPINSLWGNQITSPLGTRPNFAALPPNPPPFKTNAACYLQAIPDLTSNTGLNAVGQPSPDAEPFPFGP
jgi:phospholipid/cholesterol/gamma-HCH transport system substrate-binding protein